MKKALLGALIGLVVIINCAKDIYVPPASPIAGYYKGEYKVVRQTETGTLTKRVRVYNWKFTDQIYDMDTLTSITGEYICSSYGDYSIESSINFDSTKVENATCNPADVPLGEFAFQRITTTEGKDSLYLLQIVPGDNGWTKEAFLLKLDSTELK